MALTIEQFWRLTPYEFNLYVEGYDRRIKDQRAQAWDVATLQRCEKFPDKAKFVYGADSPEYIDMKKAQHDEAAALWEDETL